MNLKRIKSLMLFIALNVVGCSLLNAQTNKSYIDKYSPVAVKMMEENGVPASVILAIAMHESGNGGSRIAQNLNNHFGVKGRNNNKVIRSAYKGYESVMESYRDFIRIVKNKNRTQSLFASHPGENYEAWVKALAKSGYSQTGGWAAKVLNTIRKYNLDDYDQKPKDFDPSRNNKRLASKP